MKVIEFAFVGYPVTDLPRARAFYENVLDLTPATVWGNDEEGWVEYEVGPHTLAVTNLNQELWAPSEHGTALALEVDDFDTSIAELKAHGVTFHVEPTASPICRIALISDPDGNRIAIHKRHVH